MEKVMLAKGYIYSRNNKIANRAIKIGIVLAVLISAFIIILSNNNQIQAEEDSHAIKQYRSVEIEPGDTLWGFAAEYADGHYSSLQEYIDELMFINNLSSDQIIAGSRIIITYYIG